MRCSRAERRRCLWGEGIFERIFGASEFGVGDFFGLVPRDIEISAVSFCLEIPSGCLK